MRDKPWCRNLCQRSVGDAISRECPELKAAAGYVRGFFAVMSNRHDCLLDHPTAAGDSPHLAALATGLGRDHTAVTALLTLPRSSGAAEGPVNEIKFLALREARLFIRSAGHLTLRGASVRARVTASSAQVQWYGVYEILEPATKSMAPLKVHPVFAVLSRVERPASGDQVDRDESAVEPGRAAPRRTALRSAR
jgi:hypothetical protein